MNWLDRQFNDNKLFRRIVVMFLMFQYAYVTQESFKYAYYAIDNKVSSLDTVAVLGVLHALMTTLMGYVFKIYSDSRTKEN